LGKDSKAGVLLRERGFQLGNDPDASLSDVLDSLAFIDLFLMLEDCANSVTLESVVGCKTVRDLERMIDGMLVR
jgi:hypothetical protein